MNGLEEYLAPTELLDCDHPAIVCKAREVALGCTTNSTAELAARLFLTARDGIKFSSFVRCKTKDDFKASTILERGKGICIQKGAYLAALCRAAGIPSRIGLADIRNHRVAPELLKILGTNVFKGHTFVEMFVDGSWLKATPAFDSATCMRAGWPVVAFDGRSDGMLPPTTATGEPFVEYIRFIGVFPDVPYDFIMRELYDFYGEEVIRKWQERVGRMPD